MGKKEEYIRKLESMIDDPERLEKFLIKNSNLPGPRANLELAFALSELYEDIGVLTRWTEIDADRADVEDPRSFLPFCAAVTLGKAYAKTRDEKILHILKKMAMDDRWRIREAVAFGFQRIGEDDFSTLKSIFSDWIAKSGNREKRAILVSLAHPKILDRDATLFCFEILENVFVDMRRDNDFEILKKGLEFTLSVYAAANAEDGFSFMERWIGRDAVIDGIIRSNLKKARLFKKHPGKSTELLEKL